MEKEYIVDYSVDYKPKFEVIKGLIPSDYNIWNAHLLEVDGKVYLKLYNRNTSLNYNVDVNTLKALEVSEELGRTIDNLTAGGRCPQEVIKNLKSTDKYIRECAEKIKTYIEELYGVKIEA